MQRRQDTSSPLIVSRARDARFFLIAHGQLLHPPSQRRAWRWHEAGTTCSLPTYLCRDPSRTCAQGILNRWICSSVGSDALCSSARRIQSQHTIGVCLCCMGRARIYCTVGQSSVHAIAHGRFAAVWPSAVALSEHLPSRFECWVTSVSTVSSTTVSATHNILCTVGAANRSPYGSDRVSTYTVLYLL